MPAVLFCFLISLKWFFAVIVLTQLTGKRDMTILPRPLLFPKVFPHSDDDMSPMSDFFHVFVKPYFPVCGPAPGLQE